MQDGERIKASGHVAGKINPTQLGLKKSILPSVREIREKALTKRQLMAIIPSRSPLDIANAPFASTRNQGTLNNLVVFIRFSDDDAAPFLSLAKYDTVCNAASGSMNAYFEEASYGLIKIPSTFYPVPTDTTVLSYCDSHPRAYYRPYNAASNPDGYSTETERLNREQTLIKNATDYISASVPVSLNLDINNDGHVDNVSFIVAGSSDGWNELLWPHRWSLYSQNVSINGKRVYDYLFIPSNSLDVYSLCHETFHVLGAPDLYHYDDDDVLDPVAYWDLMGTKAVPSPHMGAYMKHKYGNWISEIPTIMASGTYTMYPLESSADNNCYKIPVQGLTNEFYVLEYRKKPISGFDSAIPGSGLLIYRINANFTGNAEYDGKSIFDEVYLFRPDGTPANNGNIFLANFSNDAGRTAFNGNTNPYPFLTDGRRDNSISISGISVAGDSISFTILYVNVAAIMITVPDEISITERQILLTADVYPENATNQILAWDVVNESGRATIKGDSLLLERTGYVWLKVAAQDNSGATSQKLIFISDGKSNNPVKTYWNNNNGIDGLLNVENPEGVGLIEMYSLSGAKIMEIKGSANALTIQVSFANLIKGVYVLRVWNGDKSKVSSVRILW